MPALLALFLALAGAPAAQEEHLNGVVGLLFLPQVFGTASCEKSPRAEVSLYSEPESPDAIGWIRADRDPRSTDDCYLVAVNVLRRADGSVHPLPTQEYEEEEPHAAIVLEDRAPWFKVRVREGTAWLKSTDAGTYLPIEKLLREGRSHLTHVWDGTLASEPGGPSRRATSDSRRRTIGYLEPVFERLRVALQPGQDEEEIRKQYDASSMGLSPGRNGTRILSLERGTWVEAFDRPDRSAPVVGRFRTDRCWGAVRSASSNPPEIPVFEQRPGWLQIALEGNNWQQDRRVWIEHTPVWRFETFNDDAERFEFEDDVFGREHWSVQVNDFRRLGGALWLHVQLMSHTVYDSAEPPRVVATGWLPAHDPSGAPIVWFYSRD